MVLNSSTRPKNQPAQLRTPSGSSFAMCPICKRSWPIIQLKGHVEGCLSLNPRLIKDNDDKVAISAGQKRSRGLDNQFTMSASAITKRDPPQPLLSQASSSQQPKVNAFDLLRKGVASEYRKESFLLKLTKNKLDWYWGPSSALIVEENQEYWTQQISLPGTRGGVLTLRSNILPAKQEGNREGNHCVSVLKSALQKNIRLSRPEQGMRVALKLLKTEPRELYRRILIIMFEDAILHPFALITFVFLMLAETRGYFPGLQLQALVLRMIGEIAQSPWKDYHSQAYDALLERVEKHPGKDRGQQDLPSDCQLLITCIEARKSYGGMSCDCKMLKTLASLWRIRFAAAASRQGGSSSLHPAGRLLPPTPFPSKLPSSATSSDDTKTSAGASDYVCQEKRETYMAGNPWCRWLIEEIQQHSSPFSQMIPSSLSAPVWELRASDIPCSAVDFHTSNIIEDLLKRMSRHEREAMMGILGSDEEDVLMEQMKASMWRFSSSLTDKTLTFPLEKEGREQQQQRHGEKGVWEQMAPHCRAYADVFIRRKLT